MLRAAVAVCWDFVNAMYNPVICVPASVTAGEPEPPSAWRAAVASRSRAPRPNGAPRANGERLPGGAAGRLLTHVAAAIDRCRADEIDACTVDETIHHYQRAAGEIWKFCAPADQVPLAEPVSPGRSLCSVHGRATGGAVPRR